MSVFDGCSVDQLRAFFWVCFNAGILAVMVGNFLYDIYSYLLSKLIRFALVRIKEKRGV